MDLYATVRGNEGSGAVGGGDVRPLSPEYRHSVYIHSDNTGDMSVRGETDRGAGVD